jgi:tRNA(Ile)-lysidine synthase
MPDISQTNWPTAIAAVGEACPESVWPVAVRRWVAGDAAKARTWAVALSGGADSVALLLVLLSWIRRHSDQGGEPAPRLVALHFNHRLRGAEADGDAAFARSLCASTGVEFCEDSAHWQPGESVSEEMARQARFAFFSRAMAELDARALWLGHQRDDVVETALLRLARGTGSRGLAAPRPLQRMADGTVRLRPLLDLSKAAIVEVLRGASVSWREDDSNRGDTYFRNRLRGQVVPAWAASSPADLGAAVAWSRALLEEEDDALEQWVDQVLPSSLSCTLPLAQLQSAPRAVARRALHRWLGALGQGAVLGRSSFEKLLDLVVAGVPARLSCGEANFIESDGRQLCIRTEDLPNPSWVGAELPVPGALSLPDGARVSAEILPLPPAGGLASVRAQADNFRRVLIDSSATSGLPLQVRYWKPGDRFRSLGAKAAGKLQDHFVNRHIERRLRHHLPLFCSPSGVILWVPGLPPAEEYKLLDGTTAVLQLTYWQADPLCDTSTHV